MQELYKMLCGKDNETLDIWRVLGTIAFIGLLGLVFWHERHGSTVTLTEYVQSCVLLFAGISAAIWGKKSTEPGQ